MVSETGCLPPLLPRANTLHSAVNYRIVTSFVEQCYFMLTDGALYVIFCFLALLEQFGKVADGARNANNLHNCCPESHLVGS